MTIEDISHISFEDIFEAFEGRRPVVQENKQSEVFDLHLNLSELKKSLKDGITKAPSMYDAVSRTDPNNVFRASPHMQRFAQVFHAHQLRDDPPLLFSVAKEYKTFFTQRFEGNFPLRRMNDEYLRVIFSLTGQRDYPSSPKDLTDFVEQGGQIGEFVLEPEKDEWSLVHREVVSGFKDQGVGSLLLTSVEAFVDAYAKQHNARQKIVVNCGQPRVLLMFLKKGYKPKTPQDQERIDRILNADENLVLDYAVSRGFESDGSLSADYYKEIEKDLYCFEKEVEPRTEQNALRIELVKEFLPQDQVDIQRNDTRGAVEGNV